jgi:glucan phosphoethanolaminetransferase (alkaline phosphatase superfamily)
MGNTLRNVLWNLRQRSGLFEWLALLVLATIAFRVAVGVDPSAAGALDDLVVVLVGLVGFTLAQGLPRWARVALVFAIGMAMIASHAAAGLFVRFYHTFPSCGTLTMVDDAADPHAFSSIAGPATVRFFVASILAPVVLLVVACRRCFGRRGQRYGAVTAAAAMVAIPAATLGAVLRHDHFVAADNNPLNYVLRCALHREIVSVEGEPSPLREIARPNLASFPALRSSRYRDGGLEDYPLYRVPAVSSSRPQVPLNLVVIVTESVRAFEMGLAGSGRSVTPNIDRLSREGLVFPNFYFNGTNSTRGRAAIACSLLPDSVGTALFRTQPNLSAQCLPDLLAKAGYETHWISGFDASVSNTKEFMARHGIGIFHDQPGSEFQAPQGANSWGISDGELAAYAVASLRGSREPFYAQILTVSNHAPWQKEFFPISEPSIAADGEGADYQGYEMGVHYTDYAIGKLLERSRSEPWFDRTIFVVLGDHGAWLFPEKASERPLDILDKTEMYFRSGLVVWSPKWIRPQRILTVGSQIDLAPTLLDVLGVPAPNGFEGASLFDGQPNGGRLAVMMDENSWHVREGDRYCYALGQSCFETMEPRCGMGERPQSIPHTCFEYSGELLDLERPRGQVRRLEQREAKDLLSRGERVVRANDFMIAHDNVFPRGSSATAVEGREQTSR